MLRDAMTTTNATAPHTPINCCPGATPAASNAATTPAPVMPPTLNMPCKLLITARPLRLSSTEPSVLMATSNTLIAAPSTSIEGSRAVRLEYSSTRPSVRHISRAADAAALRAPSRPTIRPAKNSEATAPIAAASNTRDSVASLSPYRAFTDGMCAPQVPASTPSARNWTRVARRARLRPVMTEQFDAHPRK